MEEDKLKSIKDYRDQILTDSTLDIKAKDEAERFLLDYELECRRSEELDNFIKSAKKELSDTKTFLKDTLRWKPSDKIMKQLEIFERRLNNIKTKYGKARKENESLREQIQVIRRNASGAQRELVTLTGNLNNLQSKTKNLQVYTETDEKATSSHRLRIDRLNQSFTTTRGNINERVGKLEEIYKKESSSVTPTSFKRPRTPYSEIAENLKVLKEMNKKWSSKVKDKVKRIEEYREKIYGLEETLEIMRGIMGIGSFSAAVKSFTDSCEQEKDLRSNILRISEKIENIQRNVKKTEEVMRSLNESNLNREKDRSNTIEKFEKEIKKLEKKSEKLLSVKSEQDMQLQQLSPCILKIMQELESLQLRAEPPRGAEDSSGIIFRLNKAEEMIDLLLSGLGLKKNNISKDNEEAKLQLNALDIEDLQLEEIAYPMTVDEIRSQALALLNSINT